MRILGRTCLSAVESSSVIAWIAIDVDLVISTFVALVRLRTIATSTLAIARNAKLSFGICKVIRRTLVLALLASLILGALLTHVLMETVTGALLATRMTLSAHGFSGEGFQSSLFLWTDPFVVMSVRTWFSLLQTSLRNMTVHDCLITTVTSISADVVLRSLTATHAVLVAVFALAAVVVLGRRTLWYAKGPVARVFTFRTVLRVRPGTGTIAFAVAQLTGLLISLVNPWRGAVLKAIVS